MRVSMIVTGWTADEEEHEAYADRMEEFETDILPMKGDVVSFWTIGTDPQRHLWYGRVMLRTFDVPRPGGALTCTLDVRLSDEDGNIDNDTKGAV